MAEGEGGEGEGGGVRATIPVWAIIAIASFGAPLSAQRVADPAILAQAIANTRFPPTELSRASLTGFTLAMDQQLNAIVKSAPGNAVLKRRVERARAVGRARAVSHFQKFTPQITGIVAEEYLAGMTADELVIATRFWLSPAGRQAQRRVESQVRGTFRLRAQGTLSDLDDLPDAVSYLKSSAGKKEEVIADRAGPRIAAYWHAYVAKLTGSIQPELNAILMGVKE